MGIRRDMKRNGYRALEIEGGMNMLKRASVLLLLMVSSVSMAAAGGSTIQNSSITQTGAVLVAIDDRHAPPVVVHTERQGQNGRQRINVRPSHSQSVSAPGMVRAGQLVLVGKNGNAHPAPGMVTAGQLVLVGKNGNTHPASDMVIAGQLVLVGKGH